MQKPVLPVDTPTTYPGGLPAPRRHWAALAIWMAMSLSVLDTSIANVALPTLARELHTNAASSVWIINAFQLAIVVSLLPLSALGDRVGYKRIYMLGVALFTVSSLGCALSHTLTQLTAARLFQGLGAAGIMSINTAIVRTTYPEKLLGRGIGYNALVVSLSSAVGPSVAAAILSVASWQWLFAVNVPVGICALLIGSRTLPNTPGSKASIDVISAILNAIALGGLVLGIESLAREGLFAGLSKLAVAAVAGALLIHREFRRPLPLVPLDLLRIPIFGLSICTSLTTFSAQMMAFVALPFLFQGVLGRSAVQTGLLMTAWPVAVGITAPIAGRLADRYPAGLLGGIGLTVLALGLATLSQTHAETGDAVIIAAMAACGAGFGFFGSPNNRAMISAAPHNRNGAAGGIVSSARLLGQTGGAVATAVFFHSSGPRAASLALVTAAGFAGAAALVSLTRLGLAPPAGPHSPLPIVEV